MNPRCFCTRVSDTEKTNENPVPPKEGFTRTSKVDVVPIHITRELRKWLRFLWLLVNVADCRAGASLLRRDDLSVK